MLSEYRRESALNIHSDFYCFLYNRSRIKSLSKYFPTKSESSVAKSSAKCLTDALFKRNKVVSSCKDVDNKRHLYLKTKEQEMTEEEKIINWLASCDNDSDDNIKLNTKDTLNEKTKNNPKEISDYKNDDLHDNRLADNTVKAMKKQWTNIVSIRSDNNVYSSNLKKSITQCSIEDQDTSKTIKSSLLLGSTESNDNESIKISKDHSPEFSKKKSSRKNGQKKISDFFQKIS